MGIKVRAALSEKGLFDFPGCLSNSRRHPREHVLGSMIAYSSYFVKKNGHPVSGMAIVITFSVSIPYGTLTVRALRYSRGRDLVESQNKLRDPPISNWKMLWN